MCILLAEFFRKSLALGEKPSVTLEEELAVARTYLAIEALRFGARLSVEEAVDDDGLGVPAAPAPAPAAGGERDPPRDRDPGGGRGPAARARRRTGRQLRLSVENPFDPESPGRPGVGLGLANVRRPPPRALRSEARGSTRSAATTASG